MSSSLGDFGVDVPETDDEVEEPESSYDPEQLGESRVGEHHGVELQSSVPIDVLRYLDVEPDDRLSYREVPGVDGVLMEVDG